MKIIGLMPVRNEAFLLPHSLASLSGFCDVVIVSDQNSDDNSVEICRGFPKVIVLESSENQGDRARWRLLDASRNYDGHNLLWWSDADELLSPTLWNKSFDAAADELRTGTALECLFHNLWGSQRRYRNEPSFYHPNWMVMGVVDDRQADYDRSLSLSLHQPRVPVSPGADVIKRNDLPVLHLQWLFARRNQMRQAWYRCREWIENQKSAANINRFYSVTLPPRFVHTDPVPEHWIQDLTFPDLSADLETTWQEREIFEWFDRYGIDFFEPLEIWHVKKLQREFRRRLQRRPRADRSYKKSLGARAGRFGSRAFARAKNAAKRAFSLRS
jgi:glycosyltransferase involved in cell wall biosynthesis